MKKHVYRERKRRSAVAIIIAATFAGLLYPILSREFGDVYAFINGFTIGFLGGVFIALFELYFYNPLNKKVGFIPKLVYKSFTYTFFFIFLILFVMALTGSIDTKIGFFEYLKGDEFLHFILKEDFILIVLYTLLLSSAVNFIHQLSRKMGQGILWNFITGKYHKPREEERIFMFLDLNHSTKIAEKIGDIEFNYLLNEIFFDITSSILSTYGEIYRYVGDEVVIMWKLKRGLVNANCIRTFFLVKNTIRALREKYLLKYGFLPTFSAGYHMGKVIVGEIGDIKSQISFSGDVLYIGANIEKQCRLIEREILVSEDLIKRLSLPEIYQMKPMGEYQKKSGKKMDLYTVTEAELQSV